MYWIVTYSKFRLSAARKIPISTTSRTKSQRRYSEKSKSGYTVAKTVTAELNDIKWNEEEQYVIVSMEGQPLKVAVPPLKDPYGYQVEHNLMLAVSKRIEFATHLNVTNRWAASLYQTTNYGLSGLVEVHNDAWGYEMGVELVKDRVHLVKKGDYLATFMGWMEDTAAGGGTAFTHFGHEQILEPKKGSAAFWINLSPFHKKDERLTHMGCPVLKGSKWIINKWISSWSQWKDWPCNFTPTRKSQIWSYF